MADSPKEKSTGLVTFSIKVDGNAIDETHNVKSIYSYNRINRIPTSVIVITDGYLSDGDFVVSNADDYKPGKTIEIHCGYKNTEEIIFSGIIVKHGIQIGSDGISELEITCKDKSLKMSIGRKNANFLKKKDSEIIELLIQNAGLSADVESTSVEFEEMVQYYCTDWDFMISRAEANSFVVCVNNETVTVKKPSTSDSPVLKITNGTDIIDFRAALDSSTQFSKVKSIGWDLVNQKIIEADGTDSGWSDQGNLERSELAQCFSPETYRIQTDSSLNQTSLTEWANAQFVKSNLSKIVGSVKIPGSAKPEIGKVIELVNVGSRFEGKVLVTGVIHDIRDGVWTTECEFGLSNSWFTEKTDIVAPSASGFLPGVEGLHIGKVIKLDEDPLSQNRIQVKIPVLQTESEGIWARLAQFYGSSESGSFFIPEIDDEVIIGYFNNDPNQPVILGSLYSSKNTTPYEITSDNFIKAIVSKEKLTIELDDEKKIITLKTPQNNTIVISDEDKSISISDQNNNSVKMSDNGISIESAKDISLSAQGKIDITASGTLDLKSNQDSTIKGNNVNITADIKMSAKGNASAEFSASGQTTVKGTMVMIN